MKLLVIFFGDETSKIFKYAFDKKIVFTEKSFQLDGNSEVEVYILNEKEVLNGIIFEPRKYYFKLI
jgi:hypothetical protein